MIISFRDEVVYILGVVQDWSEVSDADGDQPSVPNDVCPACIEYPLDPGSYLHILVR